jgi:hypothetical protein
VGGLSHPSPHIEEEFNQAVETISAATRELLARLEVGAEQAGGLAQALIVRVPAAAVTR